MTGPCQWCAAFSMLYFRSPFKIQHNPSQEYLSESPLSSLPVMAFMSQDSMGYYSTRQHCYECAAPKLEGLDLLRISSMVRRTMCR